MSARVRGSAHVARLLLRLDVSSLAEAMQIGVRMPAALIRMIEAVVAFVLQIVPPTSSLPLTDRQLEILTLLALGFSEKEVAVRLGISFRTARNHVANVYERLGLHHRAEAVLMAVRYGLVKA